MRPLWKFFRITKPLQREEIAKRKIPEARPRVARRGMREGLQRVTEGEPITATRGRLGVPEAVRIPVTPVSQRRAVFELNADIYKTLEESIRLDDTTKKRLCNLDVNANTERNKIIHGALSKFNIFGSEKIGLFSETVHNLIMADTLTKPDKAQQKRITAGRGLTVPEKKIAEKIYHMISENEGFRMPLERLDLKTYVTDPVKRDGIIKAVKQFHVDRRD